jgi:hypothetical protein
MLDRWANKAASITTPDRLIAAAVIDSFAKDFGDWQGTGLLKGQTKTCSHSRPNDQMTTLKNVKKNIIVQINGTWRKGASRDGDRMSPFWYHFEAAKAGKVNGITIDQQDAALIWEAWTTLKIEYDQAQEVAAAAKRAMEENEKKWNLVENLLDMKRNEYGALVPKQPVEG